MLVAMYYVGHFKSSRLISTRPYSCFATVLGTPLIGLPVTSNTLRLFRFTTDSGISSSAFPLKSKTCK